MDDTWGWLGLTRSLRPSASAPELAVERVRDDGAETEPPANDAKEQLEMELENVRLEMRAEIAEQMQILRGEMSELPSLGELHAFGEFQVALTGRHASLHADVARLAKLVSSLAAGSGADNGEGTPVKFNVLENPERESKLVPISTDRKVSASIDSEELESIAQHCQSAMSSVHELHRDVIWQCESIASRMAWEEIGTISLSALDASSDPTSDILPPPSRQDVLQMIDSCHALKISDARLRGSIVKHSQQLSRIWKEKLDASIHSQQQLAACKDAQAACSAAQERLAAKVDALAQEIKWQGEALNSQPWTAMQEHHHRELTALDRSIHRELKALDCSIHREFTALDRTAGAVAQK